ncbi:RNA methyltransferase [Bdellovibrio sp. ZAP7]|uniref:RNA methyltransferase n=1 Tax=Bdellovibrio sp. ZAP7 TaxID=2231053 RepID=UPI0011580C14|nr:RNA methyltransferase [Bdellovibrio sp. ZAP7]QDK45946.1 RNA methyltransferase [Bdellovibrio sp. ZAP7]
MNRFFISTPLGFENTALQEMKEIWPYLLGKDAKTHSLPFPEVAVLMGGLEFETELFQALQLNFFLKTANRLLLRMTSFRTKDLPKFYQKFKSLPWKEYLHHANVDWEVAAQKSRLNNEKRLQESAEKALQEIFAGQNGDSTCAAIYIRMEDDLCTISLDATGEHLHKRGWTVLKGEAPMRETIAAELLREMIGEATPAEVSSVNLCDPMMGSGTFLTEARGLWSGQFQRDYSFKQWKKCPKLFLSPSFALNYEIPARAPFKAVLGMDINPEMPEIGLKNFNEVEAQLKAYQRDEFKSQEHKFWVQDALQGVDLPGPLWMVVNPPYGERLPVAGKGGLKTLAAELCRLYKPQKLGILYPEKDRVQPAPNGYQIEKELKINNGGIRCLFTILTPL